MRDYWKNNFLNNDIFNGPFFKKIDVSDRPTKNYFLKAPGSVGPLKPYFFFKKNPLYYSFDKSKFLLDQWKHCYRKQLFDGHKKNVCYKKPRQHVSDGPFNNYLKKN